MAKPKCSIKGCQNRASSHGWCNTHAGLWRKYGTPEGRPLPENFPGETWSPVPGYEGLYDVSNLGRVLGWHRRKLLAPDAVKGGYLRVGLCRNGVSKGYLVHVLVATAFIGPCPRGQKARHLNGKASNNRAENIAWGTHSENMQDRLAHGTDPFANQTHCKEGHEFTVANTIVRPDGRRACRECRKKTKREWARRSREKAA